jgi:hypothetical protein
MTLDVNSALKLYTDYCTSNGYTAAPTTIPASTTSSGTPTVTVTVVQTVSVAGAHRLQPSILRLAAQVSSYLKKEAD